MKRKLRNGVLVAGAAAAAVLAAKTPEAPAATATWMGGGPDNNWSDTANWVNSAIATSDNLVFTGTSFLAPNNDFGAGSAFASMSFNTLAGAFVLTGNAITINAASASSIVNGSTATQTIDLPITLSGARAIAAVNAPIIIEDGLASGSNAGAVFGYSTSTNITLTYSGANSTVVLDSAGSYTTSSSSTAATSIFSGTLQVGAGGSLPTGTTAANGWVGLGNNTSKLSGVLELGDATTPIDQTINRLAALGTTSGDAVIGGNSAISTLNVDYLITTATDAYGGLLGGSGTDQNNLALVKSGPGEFAITGTSTYVGSTTIQSGTLQAASSVALPSGTTLIFGDATNDSGTLDLDGNSVTVGSLSVVGTGTTNTIGNGSLGANGTLNYAGGTNASVFSGNIVNSLGTGTFSTALTVTSGQLTLTGSNSYAGATTLNGGTLAIGNDAEINNAHGGLIFNGGTLQLNNYASTLALSGANVSLGAAGGAASTVSGGISDNGPSTNVTFVGPGTLVLAGNNTYSGATNVNAGTLQVASASALPAATTLTVGTATSTANMQLVSSIGAVTVAGVTVNAGSTLDLTNNPLIINYGSNADPIGTIQEYLGDGFAAGWSGGEIDSSSVANLNATSALKYSVGYIDGANPPVNAISPVASGQIEIMPTLAGDATLSGSVSFYDFQVVLSNFGKSGQSWDEGDFDYTGTVDFYDFQVVLSNFGQSDMALSGGEMAELNSFAARAGDAVVDRGGSLSLVSVPEPISANLLALGGLGLLKRKRRQ